MEIQRMEITKEDLWREDLKIKVSDWAMKQYTYNVKRNWKESDKLKTLKIIRNYFCAEKVNEDNRYIWKAFGNCTIKYSKNDNCIINIVNHAGKDVDFAIDYEKKDFATEVLGIENLKEIEGIKVNKNELIALNMKSFEWYKEFRQYKVNYRQAREEIRDLLVDGKFIKDYTSDGIVKIYNTRNGLIINVKNDNYVIKVTEMDYDSI